jgi:hypothetical protein
MKSSRTNFHTLSWRDAAGHIRSADLPRPEYQIGNSKHWTKGLTTEWQIRPVAPTDFVSGIQYVPGMWLLARRIPGVGGVYYTTVLPPHLRLNTPKNVREAVKRALRERPEMRALLEKLDALSTTISTQAMATRNGASPH